MIQRSLLGIWMDSDVVLQQWQNKCLFLLTPPFFDNLQAALMSLGHEIRNDLCSLNMMLVSAF